MRMSATGLLVTACLLSGCAELDPYRRPGVWEPLGANSANLRTMVADPNDLDIGKASAPPSGDFGAAAVARLRADAARRLPASAIAEVKASDPGMVPQSPDSAAPSSPVAAQPAAAGGSQ